MKNYTKMLIYSILQSLANGFEYSDSYVMLQKDCAFQESHYQVKMATVTSYLHLQLLLVDILGLLGRQVKEIFLHICELCMILS